MARRRIRRHRNPSTKLLLGLFALFGAAVAGTAYYEKKKKAAAAAGGDDYTDFVNSIADRNLLR